MINLMIFTAVCLALWLSIASLRVSLGRSPSPSFLPQFNQLVFAVISALLALSGLFGLIQAFPTLQGVFAWLGFTSLAGIGVVVCNPSLREKNKQQVNTQ